MAVNYNRMKNPRAAKNQQQGAIRFFLQSELNAIKVIARLKNNLEGTDFQGRPYSHKATGNLERSITPNSDGTSVWGKNITSILRVDPVLGLGIGIDEVSVKINFAEYGEKLDEGYGPDDRNARVEDIAKWIKTKARRNPTSTWYAYYKGGRTYEYSGDVPDKVARYIANKITKNLNTVGYGGTAWASSVIGGATTEVYTDDIMGTSSVTYLNKKNSVSAAMSRAFNRYLDTYDDYVLGTVGHKLDGIISKLYKE